jgi:hypothetical protein
LKYLENAKPPKGPNLLSFHPNTNKRSSELEVSSQFVISSIQMLCIIFVVLAFIVFYHIRVGARSGGSLFRFCILKESNVLTTYAMKPRTIKDLVVLTLVISTPGIGDKAHGHQKCHPEAENHKELSSSQP